MTRQKREIVKKIDEIEAFIEADTELGCGFAPADFYRPLEEKAWALREELAHLMHYPDAMSMIYDIRGCENDPMMSIPFMA